MIRFVLAVAGCLAALATAVAAAQSSLQTPVENVVATHGLTGTAKIITLRPGVDVDAFIKDAGLNATYVYRYALSGFAAVAQASRIKGLRQDSRVLAVEEDGSVVAAGQTNSTGFLRLGLNSFPVAHINSTSYWNSATGASQAIDVDVALVDTGIDMQHPDLNVVQGVDFTGSGMGGQDWWGHGTAMAGFIGAINNTFGVVGVAPGVRLWSVQVLNTSTQNSWSSFLAGLDFIAANANEISVVNASLSSANFTNNPYLAIRTAVSNVVSRGVVFVAAAGNNAGDIAGSDGVWGVNPATGVCDDMLPAALPEVMAVSAMDVHTDQTASFSTYSYLPTSLRDTNYVISPGGAVDVAAPGQDTGAPFGGMLSTWNNESYIFSYGTSAASAHVAGLVALYIAANGRATNAAGVYAIRQAIVNNSLSQSLWHNPSPNPMKNGVVPLPAPLAMPSEKWVPQPWIANAALVSNTLQLTFNTVPGYAYTVEYAASPSTPAPWLTLTATIGTGRLTTVTLADPTPSADSRFYRVVRQAAP
jgi:subtilisin